MPSVPSTLAISWGSATTAVVPCARTARANSSTISLDDSMCMCASMKPGTRYAPETSSRSPPSYRPSPTTWPSLTATSTSSHSFVNTERTWPPDSTRSAGSSPRATAIQCASMTETLAIWRARGDEPADLVLSGGQVLSVFTKEWLDVDVAVKDGHVVGLGRYDGGERLDVSGAYLVPGFIDAHMHIESSKLMVDEFARAVLAHGTTAVVADPHEIANVLGTDGIHWLLDCCTDLPLDVYVMASSCVPASRFESPRRPFTVGDIESLLRRHRTIGIAEMMNFPGVIAGDESEVAKLTTGLTDHVDGHAPGVHGPALNAYVAAGIRSDHEATTAEEALEKRRLGMWVMLREASIARNLRDLLPVVKQFGTDRCMFCTDDREPGFIVEEGHINQMVREAVAEGISPEDAVVMATINSAMYHRLWHLGAIAPGYQADILVLDDLRSFTPREVLKRGAPPRFVKLTVPEWVRQTVYLAPVSASSFHIPAGPRHIRVIGIVPGQLLTRSVVTEPSVRDGAIVADPARDLVKIAVLERHHASGRAGLGFATNVGLKRGAFASTVAHAAHSVVE